MKITFTFTEARSANELNKDNSYNSYLEVPDEFRHLIGYEQRILGIGEMIGSLSYAGLYISCKELAFKKHPIKTPTPEAKHSAQSLDYNISNLVLYFDRIGARKIETRQFKIFVPILYPSLQRYLSRYGKRSRDRKNLRKNLIPLSVYKSVSEEEKSRLLMLQSLVDQILTMLGAEPIKSPLQEWKFRGFHPYWIDNSLIDRHNKRVRQSLAAARKREREEEKRLAREAKLAANPVPENLSPLPQTGAGRRPGAIPGVFKGVQFRSQLEIRFAAELESRGIRWAYEVERLGDGQYLVDFYLPDHHCWVEVKGKFEPRDDYLLKDAASYLIKERQERLFVFMQSKAFMVNADTFTQLSREQFWDQLNKVS